jgi:hypothetical protein
MKFEIEENLVKNILNYLAERPFKEVVILIRELSKILPANPSKSTGTEAPGK